MQSLKRKLFMKKLDNGEFYIAEDPKFSISHGDKVWIGENAPTDSTIKFWIVGHENATRTVHRGKIPPTDTNKLWLEV